MRHGELDRHTFSERGEISAGPLHLNLLGAFCLCRGDLPPTDFQFARLQHLLAYIALHRTAPILRQQLAFLFWPDSPEQQAFKNLRTLLTRLRRAFPYADDYLNITPQTIQWRPDAPFTLDVAEFEAALTRGIAAQEVGDDTAAVKALVSAVDLYAGELLPGCYADWILPLREHYQQACGDALEKLVLLLEEHREYDSALLYARRLLSHDPLREATYHSLIRLHLALSDRTEALRVWRACETMLEREFGTTLSRAARDRYKRLFDEEQTVPGVITAAEGISSANAPLVGRETEWLDLLAAWRDASKGSPQMVLISGEAGIGKTRLAEELCAWVSRQGADVAVARCYPAGGVPVAYAPVLEWLRDKNLRPRLTVLEDVWFVEVSRILPTLLADRPQLKQPGPFTQPWHRTRLFEALTRLVIGPDQYPPLLLFLDDLEWCDQETLDWLGYLLRFPVRASFLIVATVRKYEIDQVHPLMAFWLALTRAGLLREISLAPLNAAETGLLAAKIKGEALDAGEAAQIYQYTEGNPLFVVEMVRAGIAGLEAGFMNTPASWPVFSIPAAFPPKVRAVIQWRLARLSPSGQLLAQTAAVIGRKFSVEVLVRASGQNQEAVLAGLDELWQRQIVRTQDGEVYDFSHDGFRAVAYDDASPVRRRVTHLHVAQAFEELYQDQLNAYSIQIASHYEQAGQLQSAISFYRRAASAAEEVYANAEAARLYQHLLEGELTPGLSRLEKCSIMLALAEVWMATGQWPKAETISRSALVEAGAAGDMRLLAQSKRVLGDVLHRLGYYDVALQLLLEAEQAFNAAGNLRGLAGVLWILGEIHWLRGNHTQAFAALERQLEISTGLNDSRGICDALVAIGLVLWSQGDWERAAESCLKSILIAGPIEYKPVLTRASITLGNIRSGEHWFGEAVYWYLHAATLAREIDDRQALSSAIYQIALILAKRGDFERAEAGFELSLRKAWEMGDRWTACLNIAGLASLHERLGKADEAETLYRQAVDFGRRLSIPGYLSGMLVKLAWFLLGQGRVKEARSLYEEALVQISSMVGERLAGEDIRFDAQVLGIRLRYGSGESTRMEAAEMIRALLRNEQEPIRQAGLYYELWQLEPGAEDARTAAADRYRTEFAEVGAELFRRRYAELTGETLPDPPPLPDISGAIPDHWDPQGRSALLSNVKSWFLSGEELSDIA